MKRTLFFLFLSFLYLNTAYASRTWYNPMQAGYPVIQNQGWSQEISNTYTRLPQRAQQEVREPVWQLSQNAAGLAIHFYSNAQDIAIRYKVKGNLQMPHMPATGVSGIDLYLMENDGEWKPCSGNFSFNDTITYHFSNIPPVENHTHGYEFCLYLPLYNTVDWLEIGISGESTLSFLPCPLEKPVLLYGSSIAQGACASRPGMAWGNILQRSLQYPLINLGFSGNGLMESEVINYISEIDARIYILDCLPNLTRFEEEEITNRIVTAIQTLRRKHTTPILLVEHAGYSNRTTDISRQQELEKANRAATTAYQQLIQENTPNIYYMKREEINLPEDGWVDYVHPNDWGMQCQATAVEKKVREILQIPVGEIKTTQPVAQRREPYNYEWKTRHREILKMNQENSPGAVIMGNSITHFWGSEPRDAYRNGEDVWNEFMLPAGYRNLGFGWDRIENVLWRVYHDELDGFEPKTITLMIGTNNMGISSDEEIIRGLDFLLDAIRIRQPHATIRVMGILPRHNHEDWVEHINLDIRKMVERKQMKFYDPGKLLLQPNGKINESYFTDGLHPNETGYRVIAPIISQHH